MAITYPLSVPSEPKPSSVKWIDVNNIAVSQSPYSGRQQVFDWSGCYWRLEVSIDPVYPYEAAPWVAFLSALRGQRGTFLFGDIERSTPLGTGAGTPKVNGAGQYNFQLVSDGWSGSSPVLKAGDFFQIDSSLYRCLQDATPSGGAATIECWPRLKLHADNSDIVLTNPKGIFRLEESNIPTQLTDRNKLTPITFSATEAL